MDVFRALPPVNGGAFYLVVETAEDRDAIAVRFAVIPSNVPGAALQISAAEGLCLTRKRAPNKNRLAFKSYPGKLAEKYLMLARLGASWPN